MGTYTLDPWQEDAISALKRGSHVIVDAPTSAGKTAVVTSYLESFIQDGGFRACYTCPVKSLSNDKVREFREKFGRAYIGISTGDIKDNLDAPLVVATLESYRNSLLGVDPDLNRQLVIFDEYHYIQDDTRGSAWEEALIMTPKKTQLLLLSASVANASEFAQWIEKITGRPAELIQVTQRPVPLVPMIFFQNQWVEPKQIPPGLLKTPKKEPVFYKTIAKSLVKLEELHLTPTLVYAGKRLGCLNLARDIGVILAPLPEDKQTAIAERLVTLDREWCVFGFLEPELKDLLTIYGLGYHHSGLAPSVRLAVESLLKDGFLRFCVGTMGLSLGINFSVRSTLIADQVRPGESGATLYSPTEILQMSGRAGRRGIDTVGYSCWPSVSYYQRFGQSKRTPCQSQLKIDPTTFLGLVGKGYSLTQIENFYKKSFLKSQDSSINMNLINDDRLAKRLNLSRLPCGSAMGQFARYKEDKKSQCVSCPYQGPCHNSLNGYQDGFLSQLHHHLHCIHALDEKGELTQFGFMARYFPQSGGLVMARFLSDQTHLLSVPQENIDIPKVLENLIQLMAGFSLARYKEPMVPPSYKFPFTPKVIFEHLEELYPFELFPEVYDTFRAHAKPVIREFNPKGGYVIKIWLDGCTWEELMERVGSDIYTSGDVTNLFFRVGSFLQSLQGAMSQEDPLWGEAIRKVSLYLWRDPMRVLI